MRPLYLGFALRVSQEFETHRFNVFETAIGSSDKTDLPLTSYKLLYGLSKTSSILSTGFPTLHAATSDRGPLDGSSHGAFQLPEVDFRSASELEIRAS